MKVFQEQLGRLDIKVTQVPETSAAKLEELSDGKSDISDEELTDPNLTLNLLRQNNEFEFRSGSAKVSERRASQFASLI